MDERVLNKPPVEGVHLSPQERNENARLFLDAARAVGCFLGEAAPEDITMRKVCQALMVVVLNPGTGVAQDPHYGDTPFR